MKNYLKEYLGSVNKYLGWLFNSKWGQHIGKMVLVAVISYQVGVGSFYLIQGEYAIAFIMFAFSSVMGAFLFGDFNLDRYKEAMGDYRKLTDKMMALISEQNEQNTKLVDQNKRLIESLKKYEG